MPVTSLTHSRTPVKGIEALQGSSVTWLELADTGVTRLGALKGQAMVYLGLGSTRTAVADYAQLRGLSIQQLTCPIRTPNELAALKAVKGLTTLNGRNAKEVLK